MRVSAEHGQAGLRRGQDVRIDDSLPVGVDWRSHLLDDLRTSDVFVVFVSEGTRHSDFQDAEIGSARFCSAFVDARLIIPVVIDDSELPRTIADLDLLRITQRDPVTTAQEIEAAIARRLARVRLFISHAHRDQGLAAREIRCERAEYAAKKSFSCGPLDADRYRHELGV